MGLISSIGISSHPVVVHYKAAPVAVPTNHIFPSLIAPLPSTSPCCTHGPSCCTGPRPGFLFAGQGCLWAPMSDNTPIGVHALCAVLLATYCTLIVTRKQQNKHFF